MLSELHTNDEARAADQRLRDIVALSTLPAIWLGAELPRIAESLAASLFTTLAPQFVYVCLVERPGTPDIKIVQTGRYETNSLLAEEVSSAIVEWTRTHDPDEVLLLPNPLGTDTIRVATRAVGHNAELGVIAVAFSNEGFPTAFHQLLLNVAATQVLTAAQNAKLLQSLRSRESQIRQSLEREQDARREAEALNEAARTLTSQLDVEQTLQKSTELATTLTGAQFGAFFYNVTNEKGEAYLLYTLAGAPREAFENFGAPRNTPLFNHTFRGMSPIRLDDVLTDPRYGQMAPHHGMPPGHLPVRSYLAVPVMSRSGEVFGGLFLGHPDVAVFTESAERIAIGIAVQAAIAIDNCRLYEEAQRTAHQLGESEALFRALADSIPQLAWMTDGTGWIFWYNQRWYDFTGTTLEQMQGGGWRAVYHPEYVERVTAGWRAALEAGEPWEDTFPLRGKDGQYRWFLSRAFPIRGGTGKIIRWFGTNTDITEYKHAEEQLRRAKQDAEAASRAKDQFLAVLSHELRTPLSPVVMTLPAIETHPDLPEMLRDDLAMVRRNIELEVKLIDDLLDLSRVTNGKLRLQMQPVRAHELLYHALRSSIGETSNKRLNIHQELHASNDRLAADPARLQQVFWNLLRNAAKFTPENGHVTIRTWNDTDSGRLHIEVRDTGVGIEPEALPRIFDAFEQGDVRMTHQFGGLGLGLAIAKAVVEIHGGTISAASEGRDQGAAFTVVLNTDLPSLEAPHADSPHPTTVAIPNCARVLLVEDHPDTIQVLAKLLNLSGYKVRTATSVASALQLAAAEPFDVVVSDIGLPDATGYELMQQIRDRYGIKGIALSGYGMESDMRRSREAGFVEHVVKPVDIAQLQAVIQRVTGSDEEKEILPPPNT